VAVAGAGQRTATLLDSQAVLRLREKPNSYSAVFPRRTGYAAPGRASPRSAAKDSGLRH
jgi:hypothetical protein